MERFHLVMALAFVVVEEMADNGRWWPDRALLRACSWFFGFEVLVGAPLALSRCRTLHGLNAI